MFITQVTLSSRQSAKAQSRAINESLRSSMRLDLAVSLRYQRDEGIWFDFSTFASASYIRRDREELVRICIERHGPGSLLGGKGLCHAELAGTVLANHGDGAVAGRSECQTPVGVKGSRVAAFADGGSCQHLATVGVDDCHLLVNAATGKQTAVLAVDREAGRFL